MVVDLLLGSMVVCVFWFVMVNILGGLVEGIFGDCFVVVMVEYF